MKVCRKCKEEKPLTEFYSNKSKSDGKQTYCKTCSIPMAKAWREANQEKVKALRAVEYATNRKKEKARAKAWRVDNPDKVEKQRAKRAAAKAAWFEANKDAITKPIKTPEEWSQ